MRERSARERSEDDQRQRGRSVGEHGGQRAARGTDTTSARTEARPGCSAAGASSKKRERDAKAEVRGRETRDADVDRPRARSFGAVVKGTSSAWTRRHRSLRAHRPRRRSRPRGAAERRQATAHRRRLRLAKGRRKTVQHRWTDRLRHCALLIAEPQLLQLLLRDLALGLVPLALDLVRLSVSAWSGRAKTHEPPQQKLLHRGVQVRGVGSQHDGRSARRAGVLSALLHLDETAERSVRPTSKARTARRTDGRTRGGSA